MKQPPTTDELIDAFAEHISAQERLTQMGDVEAGNEHVEYHVQCWREIRARGPEAMQEMLRLLDHPEDIVKVSAAACLLKFNTPACMRVLKKHMDAPGGASLVAYWVIQNWEKGRWNLDEL